MGLSTNMNKELVEKGLLLDGWLKCRVVVELMGKPKEHIDTTMVKYLEQMGKEDGLKIIDIQRAEIQKVDTKAEDEGMLKEMWTTFSEIIMLVKKPEMLTGFCLNYMPASIEIIEPEVVKLTNRDSTKFFNDLQARLHQLDLVAKQVKSEVLFLRKNVNSLLGNYVTLLLQRQPLNTAQLSSLTGVPDKTLKSFLETFVEQGKVELRGEEYSLKREVQHAE
jgi:hypothetical protein